MSRALHWARSSVETVGVLVLLAMVTLWPLGYYRVDALLWRRDAGRSFALTNGGGRLYLSITDRGLAAGQRPAWMHLRMGPSEFRWMLWQLQGMQTSTSSGHLSFERILMSTGSPNVGAVIYAVPQWSTAGAATLLLLARVRHLVGRLYRRRKGLCVVCGYDLRESPERCPECGSLTRQPRTQ